MYKLPSSAPRDIPRLSENLKNRLAKLRDSDATAGMSRRGFFDAESRKDRTELARDGSAARRLARRANALVLLDDGMSGTVTPRAIDAGGCAGSALLELPLMGADCMHCVACGSATDRAT